MVRKRRRAAAKEPGYVYFVACWDANLVKVGYSQNHPQERVDKLRCGCPLPMFRWGFLRGGPEREREIHRDLKVHRSHGEWFFVEGKTMEVMEPAFNNWHFARPTPYELDIFLAMRDHPAKLRKLAGSPLDRGGVEPVIAAARFVAKRRAERGCPPGVSVLAPRGTTPFAICSESMTPGRYSA